jgi:hypothetical protein
MTPRGFSVDGAVAARADGDGDLAVRADGDRGLVVDRAVRARGPRDDAAGLHERRDAPASELAGRSKPNPFRRTGVEFFLEKVQARLVVA